MEHRVSNSQLEELLDYLMKHPSLAKGVGLGPRSKETIDRQWEELASRLNAHGRGASKTGQRWKRYWADLKHKVKTRASAQRRNASSGTGGGPARVDDLSETDRKVLGIMGDGAAFADTQHKVPAFHTPISTSTSSQSTSVSGQRSRSSIRSRTILDKRARQRMEPSLIVDLERKRIKAEQKLADAAMIVAEAMRAQTEIARSQLEVTNNLTQALREQADIIKGCLANKYFNV